MIAMKCIKPISLLLLSVMLLALPACENEPAQIDITLQSDYSGMLAAIRGVDKTLSDKLALLEAAWNDGLADNQEALRLVRELVASLDGTMEQKLAAVASAMKAQTAGLETKLALVQEAVSAGFADSQAQQKLLRQALSSLEGTLDEKIAAVEAAVQSETTSLETKLGLIEAAVQEGFANSSQALALIGAAIEAAGNSLSDKVAAIEAAIGSRTTDLSARLALIETAVQEGFAADTAQQTLIRRAIDSLGGTTDEKLAAIKAAVQSQTTGLGTKLDLIEAAARSGSSGSDWVLEQIRQALNTLDGTMKDKLDTIREAISAETTSLETKVGLIATALEKGFLADTAAVHAMQLALDTSLKGLDADLSEAKTGVMGQLMALAAQLTPTELAKAFQGIMDAIDTQTQTKEDILKAIRIAIENIVKMMGGSVFTLTYAGEPSYTFLKRQEIAIPLQVDPANSVLSKDKMRLDVLESKQFFKDSGTEADHFSIKSLEPDPSVEGRYIATLTADAAESVWDEAILAFMYNYGTDSKPKYATTQSFQATMMPGADEGLRPWVYRYATFCARDTFYTHKQGRYEADTLGVIYYVFDNVQFRQKNGSETRSYSVDNLNTIVFVPNDGAAPVKTEWIKYPEDSNHSYPYVAFWPDTTSSLQWRNIAGLLYERMDVSGTLVLTDTLGHQTSVPVNVGWYNQSELDLSLNVSVNDKHFVKTGEQPYLPYDLAFGFKYVGLEDQLLLGCRNNTGYKLDYKSLSITQQDIDDGYLPMTLVWPESGREAKLVFDKNTIFAVGQQYRVRGRVRLKMQPIESSSGFDPRQLLITYCITLKLTN